MSAVGFKIRKGGRGAISYQNTNMPITGSKARRYMIGINGVSFALLFLLITFNKTYIRPQAATSAFLGTLSGCFPNFIAAFVISLWPTVVVLLRKPRYGRLIVYGSAAMVFIILAVEEYRPFWGASEYYDPWDVTASGLGSLMTILLFLILSGKKKSVEKM